jgi:hypothetical protein
MQYIFQSGVPRLDIALWNKQTAFTKISASYYLADLRAAGAKILQNARRSKANERQVILIII